MPYEFRPFVDKTLLLSIQSALGTAVASGSMTAATALQVFEHASGGSDTPIERKVSLPYFSAPKKTYGKRQRTIGGLVDLIGHATVGAAAPIGTLLRATGHAQTLTASTKAEYNPISSGFEYATVHEFTGSQRRRLTDVIGGLTSIKAAIGGYHQATFELIAAYASPTQVEPPTGIDLSAFQEPPTIETPTWLLQHGSTEINATEFTLNLNVTKGIAEGSEARVSRYRDRVCSGTLKIWRAALADFNPWSLYEAHTIDDMTSVVDGGAGKKTTILMPAVQFGMPKEIDLEGDWGYEIPFDFRPTTGNNEYLIRFE